LPKNFPSTFTNFLFPTQNARDEDRSELDDEKKRLRVNGGKISCGTIKFKFQLVIIGICSSMCEFNSFNICIKIKRGESRRRRMEEKLLLIEV
jgi:hypothetical protein